MSEVNYGFIDSNNKLLEIISFNDNDTETIENVKQVFNAHAYHKMVEPFGPAVIERSIWTGEYFTPGTPYLRWSWSDEQKLWVPPFEAPKDDKLYDWSDELNNWVEFVE